MENTSLKWRDVLEKFGFYCLWFLSIIKIGDLRVRWNSKKWAFYGFSKYGKWLQICHLRNQIPLTVFAKSLAEEPFSLFLIFGLNYMYQAWLGARKCHLKVQVLPCLWVVLFYYAFGFPLSWTANCFSAEPEPWIGFLDKPFIGGWKLHFLWRDLPFLPNFGLFWTKSAKNMEKECSYLKINAYLDSPHSYTAMDTNLFSLFERKSFSRWKLLHSRSFGHVTWKLWVDLPGDLISLMAVVCQHQIIYVMSSFRQLLQSE